MPCFRPQKGGNNHEKRAQFSNWAPKNCQRAHAQFERWPKGSEPAGHPVLSWQVPIALHKIVFLASVNSSSNCWRKSASSLSMFSIVRLAHHTKISCMVLNLPHVPVSISRNRVHQNSSCFGLVKELPADRCAMGMPLGHVGAPAQRSQPCAKAFPQRVRCPNWFFEFDVHNRCCIHDVQKAIVFFFCDNALFQLQAIHIHSDCIFDHFCMCHSLSSSWRLLQLAREMSQGLGRFTTHLGFLKEFLH